MVGTTGTSGAAEAAPAPAPAPLPVARGGTVIVVPLPPPTYGPPPSSGLVVTTAARGSTSHHYPKVQSVEVGSPLEGKIQVDDLLTSLGDQDLLDITSQEFQDLYKKKGCTRGSKIMLLRPSNNNTNNMMKIKKEPTTSDTSSGSKEDTTNSSNHRQKKSDYGLTNKRKSPQARTTAESMMESPTKKRRAVVTIKKEPTDQSRIGGGSEGVARLLAAAVATVTTTTTTTAVARISPVRKKKPSPSKRFKATEKDPIELSDDDMEQEAEKEELLVPVTARSKEKTQKEPIVEIGPPTIFAQGRATFPNTIDTGFYGNSYSQMVNKLQEIPLKRSCTTQAGLPFIWPTETPIPDCNGGFYEVIRNRRTGTRTQSKVARLAGQIIIHVRFGNTIIADRCCAAGTKKQYVLAEDLWKTIQQMGHPNTVVSPQNQDILRAIANLNDRDNIFDERCLFVLAEALPSFPKDLPCVAALNFQVYFRRALIGLAANPNTKIVLDALQPFPKQKSWIPCRECPPSTNQYQQSKRPKTHGFNHSLPGILWANESTGYPVPQPPPVVVAAAAAAAQQEKAAATSASSSASSSYQGVNVTLRDYQRESVAWMQSQENDNVGVSIAGLNGYFWEKRTFADGEHYYYFKSGGQLVMEAPPVVTGGLLAEEMGLGKTVITLELICSDAEAVPADSCGTLVVLPVTLLAQWEEEVISKAPHLKLFIYYGEGSNKKQYGKGSVDLTKFDIVLTTMSKLKELTSSRNRGHQRSAAKSNQLGKVQWHRLVVDEAQFLKNDTTAIARAASALTAKHIWMLSGTPLTNKLDDLRGELSLLRVWPFTLGTSSDEGWRTYFWDEYIQKPWDDRSGGSLPIIHKLMRAVSMRHSRMQLRSDGSPLVELPPRTEKFVAITMDSRSSYAYVTRWVEAAACKLLQSFGRFDVRVSGLIMKLRQLASSPALLLDQTCLEQIDAVLSEIANLETANIASLGIQKVTLVEAIKERKQDEDSPVLQELMLVAANGPASLTPCIYCKKPRSKPAYFPCTHSLCVGCCEELLKFNGCFDCPVCKKEVRLKDISEVLVPEQLLNSSKRSQGAIEVDLDTGKIDQVLHDKNLQAKAASASESGSEESAVTTYNVSHEEHIDFQKRARVHKPVTFESLEKHPKPHLVAQHDLDTKQLVNSLTNGAKLRVLINHATACESELHACPKIKALCDTIQSIRDASLEAKICVFSTYSRVLDHVEEALDNVRYTVEYDMNRNATLLPGQRVKCLTHGKTGHVIGRAQAIHKRRQYAFGEQGYYYEVKTSDAQLITVPRHNLQVEPVVVTDVPSKHVRTGNTDEKLSVNGSNDRHAVGSLVESKRPIVSSYELRVGYPVTILPVTDGGQTKSGRVVFVHQSADDGVVSYDVASEGMEVMKHVPPTRLLDKGGGNWIPAKIVGVSTKQRLSDAAFTPSGAAADPFEHAIGYVRLDGSAGNAAKRGDILDFFKRDPMTSVCLLTKEAAGVGLNLTIANHIIVLEPSMDAHDELQSIARIHRIGQTRKVSVYKFFMANSIEERILLRRQQRGELNVAINSLSGGTAAKDDDDDGGANKAKGKDAAKGNNKDSEVSSSKAITFDDLKLLLGQSKEAGVVDLASASTST